MYFNYRGINLYYKKYGDGLDNIVILPGFGDTRKTFTNLIYHLSDKFTIYIVDFPGFGNTKFPTYDLTIYDYSNLIHEWISTLKLDNVTLLGHSFGGRIIITLLGYYKYNYNNIILIDSAGIKPKKTIYSRFRTIVYKILKKIFRKEKHRKALLNFFGSSDYNSISDQMKKTFQNIVNEDLTNYLKNINSKCLLIWGENDLDTPLSDGKKMNKLIKDSELIIFKNTNHYGYLGREIILSNIIKEQLKKD